jgi:hypothetical protein
MCDHHHRTLRFYLLTPCLRFRLDFLTAPTLKESPFFLRATPRPLLENNPGALFRKNTLSAHARFSSRPNLPIIIFALRVLLPFSIPPDSTRRLFLSLQRTQFRARARTHAPDARSIIIHVNAPMFFFVFDNRCLFFWDMHSQPYRYAKQEAFLKQQTSKTG